MHHSCKQAASDVKKTCRNFNI